MTSDLIGTTNHVAERDLVYESTCGAMAELVAHDVRHAVVSPGSRSTPLTIAARWTDDLEVSMHLDERSAGFHALGLARATNRPVVLICTSGTAAANYLPAVIEAHYTGVPLLVFTADRPQELRDIGAGQTVDQVHLFGRHVRWFAELPVAGEVDPVHHSLAVVRAIDAAMSPRPGPVHLNWPLREPLEPLNGRPEVNAASVRRIVGACPAATSAGATLLRELADSYERGVIIAGPSAGDVEGADRVIEFARAAHWPILAEPLSQLRRNHTAGIDTADSLVRHPSFADEMAPDVVIRIGNSPTSKPIRQWLQRVVPAHHVVIDPDERWNDATFVGGTVIRETLPSAFADTPSVRSTSEWMDAWRAADATATHIIDGDIAANSLLEAGVARMTYAATPEDGVFYVSNSMPVRDLDTFAQGRPAVPLTLGNRGASGIDGVISSAAGAARTGRPTVLLIGDIAVVHDIGGLLDSARRDIDLTIVMPNNDGGGIFSFLPVASHDDVHFDELFHTPHGTVYSSLPGVRHTMATTADELEAALTASIGRRGVDLIEIPVDRDTNLAQHRRIAAAIGAALDMFGQS